jgi:hypothetical protein
MKLDALPGEKVLGSYSGSKIEAKSPKEWLFKRALTIGTWFLTNKRLIFEGEKPNPFFTLVMQKLPPEIYPLEDIDKLEVVPWMKMEEALKTTLKDGTTILIRLQWQTREKLELLRQSIEQAILASRKGKPSPEEESQQL